MFRVNIQNVSKQFLIYRKPYDRLLESLLRKPKHTAFKALEDISFQIGMHQSLGLIGDNGAGKSTLLKLLAGTIQPSSGTIEISGRVAALLELGAGFHYEFSGRQNIYLNASLLGISGQEMKEKEDEIIAFSQLEAFIDRPVKTYSSGMVVRLAFAISTMVNPDILIVDEALAVGDMAFQKKCIDRMNKFKSAGKTMIFCSHSMYHVQELCDQVIWLDHGKIKKIGKSDDIVAQYVDFCSANQNNSIPDIHQVQEIQESNKKVKDCRILSFQLLSEIGVEIDNINPGDKVLLKMQVEILADKIKPHFGFAIKTQNDEFVAAKLTNYEAMNNGPYSIGQIVDVQLDINFFPLRGGTFLLLAAVSDDSGLLWYEYKYIGPITVNAQKGLGSVIIKGDWKIVHK